MESQQKPLVKENKNVNAEPQKVGNDADIGYNEQGYLDRNRNGYSGRGSGLNLKDLRTFTSFKNPVFRLYYGAMMGQMAAMNMQMVARALLVYELTGSATALGAMALGNSMPMLFFSLYGGVIADRVEKKHVLWWGQIASAVIAFATALLLISGVMSEDKPGSWLWLIVAALGQGTVMGLMMPSRQAMIADIVGTEDLMNAVALNTFGMNALRLLSPIPVGFIIYFYGFSAVYVVMTCMYLIAVAFITLMPKTGVASLKGRGAMKDVVDGLKYAWNEPTIFLVLVITFVVTLLSMPYMMLLPALTENVLNVDERGFGMLLSMSGVGAMLGSIVIASLPNRKRGLMLMCGSALCGLALTGLFFVDSLFPSNMWIWAMVFIFFVGIGQTARMTLGNTLIQYYVEDAYRGRVMSLLMMEFGLTSFGVFAAGVMTDMIGVQWSVGGLAIILTVFSVLAIIFIPSIRKLE